MPAVFAVREDPDGTVYVDTGDCPFCGQPGGVVIPPHLKADFEQWRQGTGPFIQDSGLRELSDAEREQLLSGIHGTCFDQEFPDEEYTSETDSQWDAQGFYIGDDEKP